ncbi:MAG: hypothetical protein U1C33_05810 [Candidatus Cloacimonadaceae bacterium]|nr:hypothetical protein [Candidatus Cloacimonadaceae bacterium]
MKAYVKEGIKGFSGKLDGAIYYYHPRLKRTLMRKIPQMPIQEQNIKMKDIAHQIKAINPSEAYRSDFRSYLSLLRERDESVTFPSWYSVFVKMLWAMQRQYPDTVNLLNITREQIETQQLPCRTVKAAIEANLLARVPGWEYLNQEI